MAKFAREFAYMSRPGGITNVVVSVDGIAGYNRAEQKQGPILMDDLPKITRRSNWRLRQQVRDQRSFVDGIARAHRLAYKRSRENGRGFDIDKDYLLGLAQQQGFVCAVTGLGFAPLGDRKHPYSISVDRIDSGQGYIRGNVRLVLCAVNIALNEWGDETFYTICAAAVMNRMKRIA